jgi:hypothetical protein
MKALLTLMFTALAFLVHGQKKFTDPVFPSRGHFNTGVIATYTNLMPPPALIADVTYGISDKVALGITGGTTGALALYGFKLNVTILQRSNFRLHFRSMFVYYPERDGKFLFDHEERYVMPWMLSMGMVDAEWKTKKGVRYAIGMGLMEDHSINQLKSWLGKLDKQAGGLFESYHTVQVSVSFPVGKHLTIRPEAIVTMQKFRLIEKETFKISFPVNPFLNVVYSF